MAALSDSAVPGAPTPVGQRLREMLVIEESIGAQVRGALGAVAGHVAARTALERFAETADGHRASLQALSEDAVGGAALPEGVTGRSGSPGVGGAEAALRVVSAHFNEAVLGYAALHQTAHVFHTGQMGPALKLAGEHLRTYAAAVREIDQLVADVVAWELRRDGQRCVCPCAFCSLGVCWCIADTTDTLNAAWRAATPAPAAVRVARNTRAAPGLAVREGDVVVAVNGSPVTTLADVKDAAPSPAPGAPVRLTVRRSDGATEDVVATRA